MYLVHNRGIVYCGIRKGNAANVKIDFTHYSNPIKGTGSQAKKLSIGILKCTEMRGFTLTWNNNNIILDRLGVKVLILLVKP